MSSETKINVIRCGEEVIHVGWGGVAADRGGVSAGYPLASYSRIDRPYSIESAQDDTHNISNV